MASIVVQARSVNDGSPPTAADLRTIKGGPQSTHCGPSLAPAAMPAYAYHCPACTRTTLNPVGRPFTQIRLRHEDVPLPAISLIENREVSGGFAGSRSFQSATTLAHR